MPTVTITLRTAATIVALTLATVTGAHAQAPLEPVSHKEQKAQGYRGQTAEFPEGFLGLLCEGGKTADDARTGCVQLNADGTGTWENDYGPGRQEPAAKITWWVLADQKGTVTRVDSDGGRQTWVLIVRYDTKYYSNEIGSTMVLRPSRFPVNGGTRYIIDSKYRDR